MWIFDTGRAAFVLKRMRIWRASLRGEDLRLYLLNKNHTFRTIVCNMKVKQIIPHFFRFDVTKLFLVLSYVIGEFLGLGNMQSRHEKDKE